jgi:16S rRNA G966 N2-methylase RsmD
MYKPLEIRTLEVVGIESSLHAMRNPRMSHSKQGLEADLALAILDPFIGSGSTAECVMRNNRFAIGFELEEKYIGYAKERLLNDLVKQNNVT